MFTYASDGGAFTARRLRPRKGSEDDYWRAYLRHGGAVRRVDLGRSDDLTPELLHTVAVHWAEPAAMASAAPTSLVLPSPLTSLVGREREVREISTLRVVIVWLYSNTGKSVFAASIAHGSYDWSLFVFFPLVYTPHAVNHDVPPGLLHP